MRGKSLDIIRRRNEALTVKTVPKCECKLVSRPSRSSSDRLSLTNTGRWTSSFLSCHRIHDFQFMVVSRCLHTNTRHDLSTLTACHKTPKDDARARPSTPGVIQPVESTNFLSYQVTPSFKFVFIIFSRRPKMGSRHKKNKKNVFVSDTGRLTAVVSWQFYPSCRTVGSRGN